MSGIKGWMEERDIWGPSGRGQPRADVDKMFAAVAQEMREGKCGETRACEALGIRRATFINAKKRCPDLWAKYRKA